MAGDDPFAEPEDGDRTVIRPNPGGRRGTAARPAAGPSPFGPSTAAPGPQGATSGTPTGVPGAAPRTAGAGESQQIAMTGMNALVACASPLFALISRIRNRAQHVDPDKLRASVVSEVRAFEARALQAGIEAQTVKVARYALCATLDDVVLNTPWGGQSSWAMQSMVATFHREVVGGDRFYDLLARLEKDPGANIDLLEFIYQCLSLGFEGRLRVEERGSDKHLAIRNSLARIIRGQRGQVERDLSPRWKGLDKPHRRLSAWKPVWIAVGATSFLLAVTFGTLTWALGRQTDSLLGQFRLIGSGEIAVLERKAPPPPPPPPPPPAEARITKFTEFLEPEIREGIVEVFETPNSVIVRMAGKGMFRSGSPDLTTEFLPPIARVAEALNGEKGPLTIAGYSDNVPLSGRGRFKDNAALSLARAESVMKFMAEKIEDDSRMTAEGRGEKDPIGDNATPEGREKNRRIEIFLVKQESEE
jgi:type VI secretion system protein ImpK